MTVDTTLTQAIEKLWDPHGLSIDSVNNIFSSHLQNDSDDADLYFQLTENEYWSLEEGKLKDCHYSIDQGVGARHITGEKTALAYSNDLSPQSLKQLLSANNSMRKQGENLTILVQPKQKLERYYTSYTPFHCLTNEQKVDLLKIAHHYTHHKDPRIIEANFSLSLQHEDIIILRKDGLLCADSRPMIRFNTHIVVEQNNRREQGSNGLGGRYLLHELNQTAIEDCIDQAIEQAVTNLEAIDAPAGNFPVILGSGWPGILLHEAIGHGLEGDFNRKGSSAFSHKLGEKVASDQCTIVDNGTLKNKRGSLSIDDEGTPTQCTTLIENGYLTNYMQDRTNARLMNTQPTGNGRRESYAHNVLPRMTNTYMLAGNRHPDEIIQSVKKGIYATHFSGGQVDITSGNFVFSAQQAYLIENGEIIQPVKGVTFTGKGIDVLKSISMVGNDLALDHGVGTCGKDGQSVPVGVGQPTLKIDMMTVGGSTPS